MSDSSPEASRDDNASFAAPTMQRLVRLRSMLRQAEVRMTDQSELGRHSALIQLDGACEYALHLAAAELGATVKARADFHDVFAATKEKTVGWRAPGWKGVSEMHKQRNNAQHSGILPDPSEYPRWASEARQFVASLVESVFDVTLEEARSSLAVRTEGVRNHLKRAEDLLSGTDPDTIEVMRSVREAFAAARQRWNGEHRDAVPRRQSKPFSHQDVTAPDVREALTTLDDYTDVLPFGELAEYVWFQSLPRSESSRLQVSSGEAARAFSFVLDWTLRWEAFSARYEHSMVRHLSHTAVPPRTGHPRPRPVIMDASLDDRGTSYTASIQLADLPQEWTSKWIEAFKTALQEALSSISPTESTPTNTHGGGHVRMHVSMDPDGLLRVHHVPKDLAHFEVLKTNIRDAIALADEIHVTAIAEWTAWKAVEPDLIDAYRPVSEIMFLGKPLCHGVAFFEFSGAQGSLMLAPLMGDPRSPMRTLFWKSFNKFGDFGPPHALDLGRYGTLEFSTTSFPPRELMQRLEEVVADVEAEIATTTADEQSKAARLEADRLVLVDLLSSL